MEFNIKNNRRILGKTGISVSPIAYGCASAWARKLISDEKAEQLFIRALELGISYFDTGYSYGIAEERIGRILKNNSSTINRNDIVISTKFGTRENNNNKLIHDASPEWIKRSVDYSLNRMGLDYIDILYIHGPRFTDFTDEFFYVLEDYKKQKIIKASGANAFNTQVIEHIANTKCFDIVMLDYNILKQNRERQIDQLYQAGIGVVAGQALAESVFLNDIFKIKSKKDAWYLARTLLKKESRDMFIAGKKMRFINNIKDIKPSQIALKYVLDNEQVATASIGTVTLEHLESNVEALSIDIPTELIKRIRSVSGIAV